MIVVHIISSEFNTQGRRHWSLFEVEKNDIREVVDHINTGQFLFGWKLDGRADTQTGVFTVHKLREMTVHANEIYKIQTPTWKIVKFEDEETASIDIEEIQISIEDHSDVE